MRGGLKKKAALALPYLLAVLAGAKLWQGWRLAPGADAMEKTIRLEVGLERALAAPFRMGAEDLLAGLAAGLVLALLVYLREKSRRKFRAGEEYGSARWGGPRDIEPYMAPRFEDNLLLTQTEGLTMESRPKNPVTARNKNVLVIGGSGSGKTRFFLKPNLMQCRSEKYPVSFVVTDPKGSVVLECGEMLKKHGYRLKVLNTINFKKSLHYNPFHYIHSEKDVLKFVTALIANTTPKGSHSNDPFWEKAETLLLTALTAYIHSELREEEQNFISLLDLLNAMKVTEAGGGGPAGMPSMEEISLLADRIQENRGEGRLAEKLPEPEEPLAAGLDPVDLLFQELEEKDPGHFAVRQYKKYKQAAGKTAQSILISCGARLAPFDIREVRELTAFDELELDTLGDKIVYTESGERKDWKEGDPYLKTALFLIMSDTDSTFNFLISLCYTQLFNLLCEKADDVYGGRLPVHVRCLIDECANIGQIPNLEKLMATIRSREISAALVFQTQSQLKSIYKDDADTIIGNCDSTLFLGGKEKGTLKEMSELLGKETIELFNTGESRGQSESHSLNYQKLGRELMSQDELAVMDGGQCVLQVRGVRPFLSRKFDITGHPLYRELGDSSERNRLDLEREIAHRAYLRPEDLCETYDLGEVFGPEITGGAEDGGAEPEISN